MGLEVGAHNKANVRASMAIRVKLADGRVFPIGTLSNRPIIRLFQERYFRWKVARFIKSTNRSADNA